jgi:hypothetical protein
LRKGEKRWKKLMTKGLFCSAIVLLPSFFFAGSKEPADLFVRKRKKKKEGEKGEVRDADGESNN